MLNRLMKFLLQLITWPDRQVRRHEEAYLAQASDIYNLEQRMRELDRARHLEHHWMRGTGT